ncbi:uncharacterized protein LOC108596497 [Drosophila busckii]|nr:uncharacterized protein LOC108596497 [Drosophila busckii]
MVSMWCERLSATFAGMIVGLWYAKTFPKEEAPKADDKNKKKK